MQLPHSIQKLVEEFSHLPTIGRKSAERFAFYLLKRPQSELDNFAQALINLKQTVSYCEVCGALTETSPCPICADQSRHTDTICVLATTRDMISIENTKSFSGHYHILNGLIDTAHDITPDQLNINKLLNRVKTQPPREIILGLSPTFEGEATALYLTRVLNEYNIKITRLARGIPTGADIEYADEQTLTQALENRK